MPSSHDETSVYIQVEEVSSILGVSLRQATRYASKVRTQQDGRRILYHRADVEKLAQERDTKHDRPLAVHTEVMPPGRLLDIITQLQHDNARLNHENGQLGERLLSQEQRADTAERTQRQLTLDTDETRRQRDKLEARAQAAEAEVERLRLEQERREEAEVRAAVAELERDRLRAELEQAQRSWWRRLFSK